MNPIEGNMKGILWAVPLQPIAIEPRYPNRPDIPHITLQYGVERKDWVQWEGREFQAVLWELAWNVRVEALRIKLPDEIPCCNLFPHLTLSWIEGAEPKESNEMFSNPHEWEFVLVKASFRIDFHEQQEVSSEHN